MTASTPDSEFTLPSPTEVFSGLAVVMVAPAVIAFNTAARHPTMRDWLKQGLLVAEQSREAIAAAQEHWEDLTAEVQADLTENHQTETPTAARLGMELRTIAATLDAQTRSLTRGWVDLKTVIPLGLGAIALRQLLTKGLQLADIPWYVLAWYAFDSFVILNRDSQTTVDTPEPLMPADN